MDGVSSSSQGEVAIVGAGPGGLCLALALHARSVPCCVYEARRQPQTTRPFSFVLSPNGLRVLEALRVYESIKNRGWSFEGVAFKNAQHETVDAYWYGHEELFGHKALRIYRYILIEELTKACRERGIRIVNGAKFERIIADNASGVTFLINGEPRRADVLVGADGIQSTVRRHISEATPQYMGSRALYVDIAASSVKWPTPDYDKACCLLGGAGALLLMPCTSDGATICAIRQIALPDTSPQEWEALIRDQDRLADMARQNRETWNAMGQSVIDAMVANKATLALWKFENVPTLSSWTSPTGRVVVIGDAAHAIPPSSGQGINQALEDAYSLSMLLASRKVWEQPCKWLDEWRKWRQDRIDRLMGVVRMMAMKRGSEAEREELARQGLLKDNRDIYEVAEEFRWLYRTDIEEAMSALLVKEFAL